jgi:hypothetical protein
MSGEPTVNRFMPLGAAIPVFAGVTLLISPHADTAKYPRAAGAIGVALRGRA